MGVALALLLSLPAPTHADDSRAERIRAAMADTGVYLEPDTAMGELDLWTSRLETALAEVRLDLPVRVALWTPVPGLAPLEGDVIEDPAEVFGDIGLDRGISLTGSITEARVAEADSTAERVRHVQALNEQALAVGDELVAAAGDPERHPQLTHVAWAWVWLRLAGQEQPRPRQLVAELSGDLDLLADSAVAPDIEEYYAEEDNGFIHPLALTTALLVVLGAAALFLLRWRRQREQEEAAEPPLVRSPFAADLTDLQLEQEVTGLAEAIAAVEARPGDRDYDRAQAHLDAAARFVDSQLDRERVGCRLLVHDGRLLLAGKIVPARCFFNPEHYSEASVGKGDVRVPCCRACAAAVRTGRRPPALVVADANGDLAPYYETHDVWTRTGYGSLPGNWARRALLDSLTRGGRR